MTPPSGAIVRRLVLSVFQSRNDASGRGLYFGKSEGVPREARTLKEIRWSTTVSIHIELEMPFCPGGVYCFRWV